MGMELVLEVSCPLTVFNNKDIESRATSGWVLFSALCKFE